MSIICTLTAYVTDTGAEAEAIFPVNLTGYEADPHNYVVLVTEGRRIRLSSRDLQHAIVVLTN